MIALTPRGEAGQSGSCLEIEATVNADLAHVVADVDEAAGGPLAVEVIAAFADESDLVLEAADFRGRQIDTALDLHSRRDLSANAGAQEESDVVVIAAEASVVDVVASDAAARDEVHVLVDRPVAAGADQPPREVDAVVDLVVADLDEGEVVLMDDQGAA